MFLISNHILSVYPNIRLPKDTVIRVNCAWIKDKDELKHFLYRTDKPIFLDYPTGRKKPPIPNFSLDDAIKLANKNNIQYFAYSNAQSAIQAINIRNKLKINIELVPKIETMIGVDKIYNIIESIETKYIMIDKEDLFIDCKGNNKVYLYYLHLIKEACKNLNVKALELYGVIFSHD